LLFFTFVGAFVAGIDFPLAFVLDFFGFLQVVFLQFPVQSFVSRVYLSGSLFGLFYGAYFFQCVALLLAEDVFERAIEELSWDLCHNARLVVLQKLPAVTLKEPIEVFHAQTVV